MGSSAKKKRDKKKDFQKPKLKVGKTKAKADNFTDTSFKAKSIVVNQQSLTTAEKSSSAQFSHYLSLTSSRSDTQRRDALAYLTTQIKSQPVNAPLPLPTAILLPKLLPLILDGSASVRSHLLKLLRQLPASDMEARAEAALLYIRAGMTHLASEISTDALDVLEWLLEVAKDDAVSCPGGWFKSLKCFMSMMHWRISKESTHGWSSEPKSTFGKAGKTFPRQMLALAQFLKAGLTEETVEVPYNRAAHFPLWDVEIHMIPKKSGVYNRLNLFGPPRDEEGEMYMDVESRQRVFHAHFQKAVEAGIVNARKVAGEAGRAASMLEKAMREGMADYQGEDSA